jgi:hypothetical protein
MLHLVARVTDQSCALAAARCLVVFYGTASGP